MYSSHVRTYTHTHTYSLFHIHTVYIYNCTYACIGVHFQIDIYIHRHRHFLFSLEESFIRSANKLCSPYWLWASKGTQDIKFSVLGVKANVTAVDREWVWCIFLGDGLSWQGSGILQHRAYCRDQSHSS